MKKVIKTLIILLIIGAIGFGIYYYRNELINLTYDIGYKLNLIDRIEEDVYTEEQLQEIINNKKEENYQAIYSGKIGDYYYNQLNSNSRIIYRVIKDNLETIKSGKYSLKLPNILEESLKNGNTQEQLNKDFQNAWDAIKLDMPEIYYINVDHMCLITKKIESYWKVDYELYIENQEGFSTLPESLLTEEQINSASNQIKKVKLDILKNTAKTDAAKVLVIHNWIIENIKYDETTTKDDNNNIYGALVKKEVVCEGYAKTFKYLLDEANIPCVIVCGTGIDKDGKEEKHAWNYVYLDGKWYAVDVTWDDPIIIGNGALNDSHKYKYFLKGSEEFFKNHTEVGNFTKDGIVFKYPELSKTNYLKK